MKVVACAMVGLVLLVVSLGTIVAGVSSPAKRPREMPEGFRQLYVAAAESCPGLPAEVLMGIGDIESGHGANPGPSSAGAIGPMQFMPETWAEYGLDVDGDGVADPWDEADAIYGAARMLCANGAGNLETLVAAIGRYNPGDPSYPATILDAAVAYAAESPLPVTDEGGSVEGTLLPAGSPAP
ncbi:MAG: lytic transglycosylase domain-containing protein [Actinomycetota bacterium]